MPAEAILRLEYSKLDPPGFANSQILIDVSYRTARTEVAKDECLHTRSRTASRREGLAVCSIFGLTSRLYIFRRSESIDISLEYTHYQGINLIVIYTLRSSATKIVCREESLIEPSGYATQPALAHPSRSGLLNLAYNPLHPLPFSHILHGML